MDEKAIKILEELVVKVGSIEAQLNDIQNQVDCLKANENMTLEKVERVEKNLNTTKMVVAKNCYDIELLKIMQEEKEDAIIEKRVEK